MQVPFLDLKAQYRLIKDEVKSSLKEVMVSTAFASGPFVQRFEEEFAEFCDQFNLDAIMEPVKS